MLLGTQPTLVQLAQFLILIDMWFSVKGNEMKNTLVALLAWILMDGMVLAQESISSAGSTNSMQEYISNRIASFMTALNIVPGSEKEIDIRRARLTVENLKTIGAFVVRHMKGKNLGDGGVSESLEFLDKNGDTKGSGIIIFARSEWTAQQELFKRLVVNSMPLDAVLARYSVNSDGPGDISIVEKKYDKERRRYVVDASIIHVIHGNIAMSIHVEDPSIGAEVLARQLDDNLIGIQ